MPFPVTWGSRTWNDGPTLLADVGTDACEGGGAVVDGQPPCRWVAAMVQDGALERELAVGLVAALLQRRDQAAALAEAARLAVALEGHELADLVFLALDAFDTGLLLTADPLQPGASVEDALLRAAWSLADLSDPALRARLLPRLRNAGLTDLECIALVNHGDPDEIRTWLPAILVETVPPDAVEALIGALSHREEVREALLESFEAARPDARADLLEAITRTDRGKALRAVLARLVPTRAAEA